MRGRASWVVLAGGLTLFSSVARAQCTKDTDCKGDRVCEAGKCTAPAAPPETATPPATTEPAPAAGEPVPAAAEPVPAAAEPRRVANDRREPAERREAPAAATAALAPDEPVTLRRSKPAMVAGIVMISVTPIALLGALSAKNAQDKCDERLQRDYPGFMLPESQRYREEDCNSYSPAVYALGIGGAVLGAIGIPLLIYGAKSVPARTPQATVQVAPWAGIQSGGLRLKLSL